MVVITHTGSGWPADMFFSPFLHPPPLSHKRGGLPFRHKAAWDCGPYSDMAKRCPGDSSLQGAQQ